MSFRKKAGKKEKDKDQAGALDVHDSGSTIDLAPESLRARFPALSPEDSKLLSVLRDPLRGLTVKDRKWRFRKYKQCFVAKDVGLLFVFCVCVPSGPHIGPGRRLDVGFAARRLHPLAAGLG
jgi:hypothetical protein